MSAINEASKNQEQRRRETLAALAEAGSAGVDAYQNAQAEVTKYRDTALNAALEGAASRGASGAAGAQLASIVRGPGDRTLQNLAAAQGTYEADMARRTAANEDYFAQAKAAVPVIQAASARDISFARERWAQQKAREEAARAASEQKAAEDAKWEQQNIAFGLAEMQAEAERQRRLNDVQEQQAFMQAPVSNPTFDPVGAALLLATGGGTPEQRAVAEQAIAQPMAGATFRAPNGQVVPVTPTVASPVHMGRLLPEAARSIAEEIALAQVPENIQAQRDAYLAVYGEDPRSQALARGLFRPPTPAQQLSEFNTQRQIDSINETGYASPNQQLSAERANEALTYTVEERELARRAGINDPENVRKIRESPGYAEMRQIAEDVMLAGGSAADLKYHLTDPIYANRPKTAALILAEFGPRLLPEGYIPDS